DAFAKFRHDLKVFQTFEIHTRVIGWDSKWVFFEHRFVRKDRVIGVVAGRAVLKAQSGPIDLQIVSAELGHSAGIMAGSIGPNTVEGTILSVSIQGKSLRVKVTSGLMRSARMSRLKSLNSAVPATRRRSGPRRLVTILAPSSRRLTDGAAACDGSFCRLTVIE